MIRNLKGKLDALRDQQQIRKPDPVPEPPCAESGLCRYERFTYPVGERVGSLPLSVGRDPAAASLSCLTLTALPEDFSSRRMLYLDTETTGLSTGAGALAFLVGIGFYEGDSYVVEQYMMEDFDQEPDMLRRLLDRLEGFDTLVTYNGKSFDVPLLEVRYVMNRLVSRLAAMTQLDLLHAARRLYRRRLPSCSLGSMERELLGIERVDDIPGAEIPECFFAYVKDRDPTRMNIVLKHNRQDILTMPLLMGAMLGALEGGGCCHGEDDYSLGRLFLRNSMAERAEFFLKRAAGSLQEAAWELSLLYKRQGRMQEAMTLWQDMIAAGEGGTAPYHELAKVYEHRLKQPDRALALMEELKALLGRWGMRDAEVDKRYQRLKRTDKGE